MAALAIRTPPPPKTRQRWSGTHTRFGINRSRRLRCQSSIGDITDQLGGAYLATASALVLYAGLPLASAASPAASRSSANVEMETDNEEQRLREQEWRLMGFIAFVPLGYWTAWLVPAVLERISGTEPALSDASSSGSSARAKGKGYVGLAAFYSLPILLSGGNPVSTGSFLALVLCAAHVQIARLKDSMDDDDTGLEKKNNALAQLGEIAAALTRRATTTQDDSSTSSSSLSSSSSTYVDDLLNKADDDSARRVQEELERFDVELQRDADSDDTSSSSSSSNDELT